MRTRRLAGHQSSDGETEQRGPGSQCDRAAAAAGGIVGTLHGLKKKICCPLLMCDMDIRDSLSTSPSASHTMQTLLSILISDPAALDSEQLADFIAKLAEQKAAAEELVSIHVLDQVHQSPPDRLKSWFKYEIFLTKALVTGLVTAEEFEGAVLPLLKADLNRSLLAKFGSCLKGAVSSYRKNRSTLQAEEQFVETLEWIGWMCSSTADF